MAQNDTGFRTFPVGASALTQGQRVALASGLAVAAGNTNASGIGVATSDAAASGLVTVKLNTASGTHEMKAGGTIAAGAAVYPAAAGAVSTTVAGNQIGIALESAVSGDIFEVLLGVNAHA